MNHCRDQRRNRLKMLTKSISLASILTMKHSKPLSLWKIRNMRQQPQMPNFKMTLYALCESILYYFSIKSSC